MLVGALRHAARRDRRRRRHPGRRGRRRSRGAVGRAHARTRDARSCSRAGAFLAIGVANAVLVWVRRGDAGVRRSRAWARVTAAWWPTPSRRLPLGWHRANPAGRMLSAMSSDSETATDALHPFAFTARLVRDDVRRGRHACSVIDPWLALTGMAVVPVILGINLMYERVITPRWDKGQNLRAEVSTIAHESFEGGTVVKALGAEARETERFRRRRRRASRRGHQAWAARAAWFEPMMDLVVPLGSVALMVVGAVPRRRPAPSPWAASSPRSTSSRSSRCRSAASAGCWARCRRRSSRSGASARSPRQPPRWTSPALVAVANAGPGALRVRRRGHRRGRRRRHPQGSRARRAPPPRARDRHRVRGRHGFRQDHASRMAAARLSRAVRGTVRLDGTDMATVAALGAARRTGAADRRSSLARTVRENVTLGEDFTDDEVWEALRAAIVDEVDREARGRRGDGPRRRPRGARHEPLGRPAPAHRHRARARAPPARAGARRRNVRGRPPRSSSRSCARCAAPTGGPTVLIIAYRLASILLADQRGASWTPGASSTPDTHAELLAPGPRLPGARHGLRGGRHQARGPTRERGGRRMTHQRPSLAATFSPGFRVSPEFRKGLGVTLVLAAFAAVGARRRSRS